jgi:hypothetical protein
VLDQSRHAVALYWLNWWAIFSPFKHAISVFSIFLTSSAAAVCNL